MSNRFRLLFALTAVLALAVPAYAQYGASLQGTVADKTGAVVPGAKVTVTNQDTQVSTTVTTSASGFYRASGLTPGKYTVTVDAASFSKSTIKDVDVAAELVRGLDVTVTAGSTSQTVTVTDQAVGVETENANVDGAITTTQIERLPEYGRDPYELLRLAPGVFGDGARAANGGANWLPNTPGPGKGDTSGIFNQENYVQASANGQRPSANNFTIDGTSVNSLTWGGATIITPNPESIAELTVVSSTYSAEDGRNSGAQVKVVSKTGTNALHGSAFFKYDEPGLNASNRFTTPTRVDYKGRDFAGSIGGPIVKNKLFFFFSYEGNIANSTTFSQQYITTTQFDQWVTTNRAGTPVALVLGTGNNAPRVAQVLTPNCADFAGQGWQAPAGAPFCQAAGSGLDLGSPTGTYGTYAPFFNGDTRGGGLDGIPDVEKALLALPTQSRGNQFNLRVDYSRGKDLFAFSAFYVPRNDTQATNSSRPTQDLNFDPRNRYAAIIWNRAISATMFNEFRFNATRQQNNQYADNPKVNWGLPRFEVEAIPLSRITWGPTQGTNSPLRSAQNQFEFRDNLSKNWGRHLVKFGGNLTFNQDNNDYEFGGARPVYVFHGLWNLANGAPIYEAIDANPNTGAPTDTRKYYRQRDWALFVQDDFKVSASLTLNLGVRYEYFQPLNEVSGAQSNLVLGTGANPFASASVVVKNPLYDGDKNNIAPRLGFAWSPFRDHKTVFRGGFGVSYNRITDTMTGISRVNPPFMFRYGLCCGTAANEWGTPFVNGTINLNVIGSNLTSIYNYGVNPALVSNYGPNGLPLTGAIEIWGSPSTMHTPRTYNYSADVQEELPARFVATIGYEGSDSPNIFRIKNLNYFYPSNPNISAAYFPATDAYGNYNALLVTLNRQFVRGFQLFGKYRWSKSMDTVSAEGACACTNQFYPPDQQYDYGPSDYDATHSVAITALYDLPFVRKSDTMTGKLLGGWHVDGSWQFHSGFPWSAVSACAHLPSGNYVCPTLPNLYTGIAGTSETNATFMKPGGNFPLLYPGGVYDPNGWQHYFQFAASQTPPLMHRNAFRGPRFRQLDMAFAKNTRIGIRGDRNVELDFRANFFNVFNQLNLAPFQWNSASTQVTSPQFGTATDALAGRVVDFQIHLKF